MTTYVRAPSHFFVSYTPLYIVPIGSLLCLLLMSGIFCNFASHVYCSRILFLSVSILIPMGRLWCMELLNMVCRFKCTPVVDIGRVLWLLGSVGGEMSLMRLVVECSMILDKTIPGNQQFCGSHSAVCLLCSSYFWYIKKISINIIICKVPRTTIVFRVLHGC